MIPGDEREKKGAREQRRKTVFHRGEKKAGHTTGNDNYFLKPPRPSNEEFPQKRQETKKLRRGRDEMVHSGRPGGSSC